MNEPYSSDNSVMLEYLNLHQGLEQLRESATQINEMKFNLNKQINNTTNNNYFTGPRVLVIGGTDVGKSTL